MKQLIRLKTAPEFETTDTAFAGGRERAVLIEVHPAYLSVRLKGTRQAYTLNHGSIFVAAAWKAVEGERKAARKVSRRTV